MGISRKNKNDLRRAVFLDRDGVINDVVDRGENFFVLEKKVRFTAPWRYNEFKIKEGVREALQKMRNAGWLTILVTNQPDITYGLLPKAEHERIMADLKALPLDDIYVCPHGRHDNCDCKKPKPGMLLVAAKKWNIDLSTSIVIGDTESDVGAARAAGCSVILIDRAYNKDVKTVSRAANLNEVLEILKN